MLKKILLGACLSYLSTAATADVFMDEKWAGKLCDAWNENTMLTNELATEEWMGNNSRGYKLIQMYRTSCGEETMIQLKIEDKNNQAICTYGGLPDGQKLSAKVDYRLHAKDQHWEGMGKGTYGPFKAMMFGYLNVQGPYDEAMYAMTPFSSFLKLAGLIPGDKGIENCPTAAPIPN